jgi:hypothetical protein
LFKRGAACVAEQLEVGFAVEAQLKNGAVARSEGRDAQQNGLLRAADEGQRIPQRAQQEGAIRVYRIEVGVKVLSVNSAAAPEPRSRGGGYGGGNKRVRPRSGDESGNGRCKQDDVTVQHAVTVQRESVNGKRKKGGEEDLARLFAGSTARPARRLGPGAMRE